LVNGEHDEIPIKTVLINGRLRKALNHTRIKAHFCTWLAMMDIPVLVISKLLGHKSTRHTTVYIHIAEGYKAIQMMKLQTKFGNHGFDTITKRKAGRVNT
jgi:integrase